MASIQSPNTGASKCAVACFFTVFVSIALFMGFIMAPIAPFPISMIPIGMAVFGLLMCIVILAGISRTSRPVDIGAGFSIRTTGDQLYSEQRGRTSRGRVVFQVPNQCPTCRAPLSSESIEWVGPLQAQCPYCYTVMDATEREL